MNENNYINEISDAHWLFEYHDIDNSANIIYDDQFDLLDDYNQNVEIAQNVNFLTFAKASTITHNCNHCNDILTFRNQLFKHLRNACWFDIFEHVNHAILIVKLSFLLIVSTFEKNSNIEIFHEKIYEFSQKRRVIQSFVRFDEINFDYVFREYQYDQVTIKLDNNIESIKICIDIDCSVIMIASGKSEVTLQS